MDDSKIIDLFFERSEKAISELSSKYGGICLKIATNVLRNHQDAEECVNDSFLGVWNAIPPKRPSSLLAFVCRLVRNISINRYEYNSAQKRNGIYDACLDELRDCISHDETAESEYNAHELSRYIDEYLDTLDSTNRMIFVRRYWYMDSFKDISSLSGLSEGAVRTRLSRLRGNLKKSLEGRGIIV